jgi:hypothetical protein
MIFPAQVPQEISLVGEEFQNWVRTKEEKLFARFLCLGEGTRTALFQPIV